ncbi:MAG: xylanase/chitin deacetylase [Candidatus Saccharibacteria bacterium]|nr:xylanase/chitin deacetylase [Candidatus Saccharibacteria bacterium]
MPPAQIFLVPKLVLYSLAAVALSVALLPHTAVKTVSISPPSVSVQTVNHTHVAGISTAEPGPIERQLTPHDPLSSMLLSKLTKPPEAATPTSPNCAIEACVALTFDDGPAADSTPIILSALEKHGAHASFFLIGVHVATNTALVQRMHMDGDDIGNHSWTHPFFTKIAPDQIQPQIDRTQAAIAATGAAPPHIFRPPYGALNPTAISRINLPIILWNVDPKDWSQPDPAHVAQIVEAQVRPGALIVMHDKVITAQAIDKILSDLAGKYRFVTVSELLNLTPTSHGVFRGL